MNPSLVIKRVLWLTTTFSAVNKFVKRAIQIDKKCRYLTGLDASETRFDGEIVLFYIGNDDTPFLSDLYKSKDINIDNVSYEDYEQALKGRIKNKEHKSILITITTSKDISRTSHFLDGLIIVQNSDVLNGERFHSLKNANTTCGFIEVCTQENLFSTINRNVERIVLHSMKDAVVKLKWIYDSKRKHLLEHTSAASTDIAEAGGKNDFKLVLNRKRKISTILTRLNESDSSLTRSGKRFRCSYDETERVTDYERERALMKDTLHEAFALFSTRNISKDENPFQATYRWEPVLSPELKKAVYRVDRRIYGCGFRNFTLEVFVNIAQRIPTTDERQSLKHRIETTAIFFKIDDVDVNFGRYGQTKMSSCRVGSKIKNDCSATATLGGFAKSENTDEDIVSIREHASRSGEGPPSGLYVLLSRHFADSENVEFIYFVDRANKPHLLAKKLKAEIPGEYDIAIAKVMRTDITDTQFRDLSGQTRESDLVHFSHMDFASLRSISELEVYFWSAEEEPRIGKVVIPDFDERATSTKLVLLKDIMVYDDDLNTIIPKRMFQKGHSGAIVCYDDERNGRVRVLAMFMGAVNYKDIEDETNGWRIQGEYRSFPMSEGLKQLNEEHGGIFVIC